MGNLLWAIVLGSRPSLRLRRRCTAPGAAAAGTYTPDLCS